MGNSADVRTPAATSTTTPRCRVVIPFRLTPSARHRGRSRAPRALASELLSHNAQVVGGFEVWDPVVEEADAVRLAEAIQLVDPDRPAAQPLSEALEEQL